MALNYNNNKMVVDILNYKFLYPRVLIEKASQNGLFFNVPEEAQLILNTSYNWEDRYYSVLNQFYQKIAPDKFKLVLSKKNINEIEDIDLENSFYLYYDAISRNDGYALLGNIAFTKRNFKNENCFFSNDIYLYIDLPLYQNDTFDWIEFSPKVYILGEWTDETLNNYSNFILEQDSNFVEKIAQGQTGRLYKMKLEDKFINLNSIVIEISRNDYLKNLNLEQQNIEYKINEVIDSKDNYKFFHGWSYIEGTCRWSEKKSKIIFKLRDVDIKTKRYNLVISAGGIGKKADVYINNNLIGTLEFTEWDVNRILFDASILKNADINTIEFYVHNAQSPGKGDNRLLGICVAWVKIEEI